MIVREFVFGVPAGGVTQGPTVREQTWDAISVTENGGNGGNGPTPTPKFPWYLFAIAGVVIVGIRTKKVLDKDRRA